MDTAQLRAFVAVAKLGRFHRAARELDVTQPTLSRRLMALEADLGVRLVARTPRGPALTESGAAFLPYAQRALADLDDGARAVDDLGASPRGTVTIGALATVSAHALPAVLGAFRARYPKVLVRVREGFPAGLEDGVASGDLDLALVYLPVRREGLATQLLFREPYFLLVPKGHRLASAAGAVALGEVAGEPLVVVPNVPATRALEAACERRGVPAAIVVEADTLWSLRQMVAVGLGLGLVPQLLAKEEDPRIVAVPVSTGGLERRVALLHRGTSYLTGAAKALAGLIFERLRAPR